MDDGGGKFDHGVCLVLVCTRNRLSPPPFKALTGRWSRDKTEAPSTGRGAMLILILPEVQVVGKLPLSAVHVLQMVALFLQPGSLCPLR